MVPLCNILLCMTLPYINVYILQRSVHTPTLSLVCILTAAYFMFCSAMVIIFLTDFEVDTASHGNGFRYVIMPVLLLIQFQLSV